jgi:alanyl-tRNA synthetase
MQAGDYSLEFCGGTHLQHTSQAGLFKVVAESSSQAGVRRIEAVTGRQALMRLLDQERLLSDVAAAVKTTPPNVLGAVDRLQTQLKERERELATLQKAAAGNLVDELVAGAKEVAGVTIVSHAVMGKPDADTLRLLTDEILNRVKSGVVILGGADEGKVSLAVKVSKDLIPRGLNAGNLVREAAKVVGGGGGGRPEFAQAGGKDPSKLGEALETAERLAAAAAG